MKTTEWKQYGDRYRIRATYGFQRIGDQNPYFSITAEVQRFHSTGHNKGRWVGDSWGCQHDLIRRHLPELADLIPWHLVAAVVENGTVSAEPMHYFANARYWLEKVYGLSRWVDPDDETKAGPAFWSTVVRLPGERVFRSPVFLGFLDYWLRNRLPRLNEAFRDTMNRYGVKLCQT